MRDVGRSTLAEDIAGLARNTTFERLDRDPIEYAKLLVLSCVGAMVGGSQLPASRVVAAYAARQGARPVATVAGTALRTSTELATLVNATSAHATEYEDDSFPEGVSSYTIIPPLLALAEERRYGTKGLIVGIVVGQEVQSLLGRACLNALARGYQLLPVLGTLATAAGAAVMMDLDRSTIATAISIAVSQAAGMRIQNRYMTHFLESGTAARAGILSAFLAEGGLNAAPYVLEGLDGDLGFLELLKGSPLDDPSSVVRDWGSPYRIREIGMKTYPACGLLQPVLQGLTELRGRARFALEDVVRIEIVGDRTLGEVCDIPDPSNHAAASMSLQHNVAVALTCSEVSIGTSFSDDALSDPQLKAMRHRVHLIRRERAFAGFELVPIGIRLHLTSGKVLEATVNEVNGYPPAPLLSKEDAFVKFERSVRSIATPSWIDRAAALVMDLDEERDAGDLARVLALPAA